MYCGTMPFSPLLWYYITRIKSYEARTHQLDGVSACSTQVGHRRALDTSTTCVWHAVLRVSFKKYYLFGSDTRRTQLNMARTRAEHGSDARRTRLNTARIRPKHNLVLFFPIIWWIKKEFKGLKTQVHLEILFEVSIEIIP